MRNVHNFHRVLLILSCVVALASSAVACEQWKEME
jgi:hypothetical protein